MLVKFSRRKMLQGAGAAALAQTTAGTIEAAPDRKWPIEEGPDTPKLCLAPGDGGGPLPVNLQPPAASAAPAGGRGGRGGGGGGYGGYLAPAKGAAPAAAPADAGQAGRGGGFGGNVAASYQR